MDAYLRQHFPNTAAIGRVSRSASHRTEGGSSRKAMVNCGRGVDHPKLSYNFMQASNGRAEIKVDPDPSHWLVPPRSSGEPSGAAETETGIVRDGTRGFAQLDVILDNTELQNPHSERLSLSPAFPDIYFSLQILSNTEPQDNGCRQSC